MKNKKNVFAHDNGDLDKELEKFLKGFGYKETNKVPVPNIANPYPQQGCPNCGYCPHCGRGGNYNHPIPPVYCGNTGGNYPDHNIFG